MVIAIMAASAGATTLVLALGFGTSVFWIPIAMVFAVRALGQLEPPSCGSGGVAHAPMKEGLMLLRATQHPTQLFTSEMPE
jgi:hypothetical protein